MASKDKWIYPATRLLLYYHWPLVSLSGGSRVPGLLVNLDNHTLTTAVLDTINIYPPIYSITYENLCYWSPPLLRLLTTTEHYWLLLTTTEHYWLLLTTTDRCWLLLTTTDHYWPLLTTTDCYCLLLTTTNCYWPPLIITLHYWQ